MWSSANVQQHKVKALLSNSVLSVLVAGVLSHPANPAVPRQPLHLPHHRTSPQASSQLRFSFESLAVIQQGGEVGPGAEAAGEKPISITCFVSKERRASPASCQMQTAYTNVLKSMGLQMAVSNRRLNALQSKLRIGPSVTWNIHLRERGTFTNSIYLTSRKKYFKIRKKKSFSIYSVFNSFRKGDETRNKHLLGVRRPNQAHMMFQQQPSEIINNFQFTLLTFSHPRRLETLDEGIRVAKLFHLL